jgi:hypothetical protein
MVLKIYDGKLWHFENGAWEDGGEGILKPVANSNNTEKGLQGYNFAFYLKEAYKDFEVNFEFLQKAHSDVGFIFMAKNSSNFYVLHFPCCGQACRAQHFWAALSMMDSSGYLRIIKREMVNRVNSMVNYWHTACARVKNGKLYVEIDGRGIFEASLPEYGAGFLGTMVFNSAQIKNAEIKGMPESGFNWDTDAAQATNWFYPCPTGEYGKWQMPLNLLRTPKGDLLLYFSASEGYSSKTSYYFTRSYDNGRTWTKPEHSWKKSNISWEGSHRVFHVFPDGSLKCIIFADGVADVRIMETADGGHTWSAPKPVKIGDLPKGIDKLHVGPQAFANLDDGSVMMMAYGAINTKIPDTEIYTWGSMHCQAFVCHSTDGGYTWSGFINVDGTKDPNKGNYVNGNMDFTEVCAVQTADGSMTALIRPIYSPWMWEAKSNDRGKTWEPAVRGPFPGYATPNMIRTRSGYIVVAHRLPGLTVDVSLDDGKTWSDAAMIDSGIWAMGSMLEVEPDVILYVYMDSFESLMRAQFIRIKPEGIMPLRVKT